MGTLLRYEPAAIVFHQHRRTLAELEAQMYDHGSQWAMMMSAHAGGRASAADIRSVLGWYVTKHWPRQLLRAALIPNRVPLALAVAEVRGMAAAAADRWYRRVAPRQSRCLPLLRSQPRRRTHDHESGRDSATEVVTVDVASTITLSEPPPGTAAMSVLVTRGHAAIGRVEVETGGRSPTDRQLRELVIDELGVRVLEECAIPRLTTTCARRSSRAWRLRSDVTRRPIGEIRALPGVDRRRQSGSTRRASANAWLSLCRHRSRHEVEVVVVDNNPASGLTASVLDDHPDVVRVSEPRRGLAYARNAGFLAATGEILVTTDDDVRVPDGWLDLLLEPFERNDVMAVCGNVQPIELRHPAQVEFEAMGGLGKGFDRLESRWESPRSAWRAFRAWDLGATGERGVPRPSSCPIPRSG